MTLGEYYDSKNRGIDPERAIRQVHDNIMSEVYRQHTVAECKELQDFLNEAFYPEKYLNKGTNKYAQAIPLLIAQAYQEKYDAVLNNFSMGASGVSYGNIDVTNIPTLLREKHESFEHKTKIYTSTIEDRLSRVKTALQHASDITSPEIAQYKKELQSLESILSQLLEVKGVRSDKRGTYIDLTSDASVMQIVRDMDEKFAAASKVGGIFTPQDYGQVLEWILQAFSNNGNSIADQGAEYLVGDFVEKMTKTAGSSKTTKIDGLLSVSKVTVDGTSISQTKNEKGQTEFSVSDGQGNSFSFAAIQGFNPNSERQGKMDVNFTFNDKAGNVVPFRISAKNWQTLDRDFGETNIAYALLRSAGNESAVEYAYAMQDEHQEGLQDAYHRVAKYSILVDILMGYSQKENYADTIVINVRNEKRVIVASIIGIIDEINKNLNQLDIAGYDDVTLETRIRIIRQALDRAPGRSKEFISLSMKYLQATKVRLTYSAIQHAIKTPLTT